MFSIKPPLQITQKSINAPIKQERYDIDKERKNRRSHTIAQEMCVRTGVLTEEMQMILQIDPITKYITIELCETKS